MFRQGEIRGDRGEAQGFKGSSPETFRFSGGGNAEERLISVQSGVHRHIRGIRIYRGNASGQNVRVSCSLRFKFSIRSSCPRHFFATKEPPLYELEDTLWTDATLSI